MTTASRATVTTVSPATPPASSVVKRRLGYLALAAIGYIPVLLTAPGKIAADTKQYLYLDPGRLLGRAVSMWDNNIGLGTVSHQTIGYVFPMGPYYWLCEHVGLPDWVAQRLWLGSILFVAALGMLYLLRTLGVRGAGAPVAALAYMLSPYSLDYAARISVILLPFAGLPWMLALVIRALRTGNWRYPALFAIVVQVVGGVNSTALVFAGVAPVLWIVYSVVVAREVTARRALVTTARIGVLTILASLWWIAGLSIQAGYGIDVLRYTETVKTVSTASVAPEVFRGLGYWFFYGRDKLGPWIESGVSYTQWVWLILVGYAIPTLALASAALVRWKHRMFFALLTFVGLAIAVGAHPYDDPSLFGRAMKAFADKSSAGLALRSTGRAVPLVALSLAVFLAVGINAFTSWFAAHRSAVPSRVLVVPALIVALVIANFPALWNGSFYGKNLQRPQDIPQYWKQAISALDNGDHSTRVLEIPGADFASYRWGNTVDPITPGLTNRPYVARELIPWGSPPSADLLNALDRRLEEGVLDPASIAPIAQLMGVGAVVARNDLQVDRYNLVRPVPMKMLLTPVPKGLGGPASYGTSLGPPLHYPLQDEIALALPNDVKDPAPVAIYSVRDAAPIVRAQASDAPLVMAGDGEGLVSAAAIGLVTRDGIVVYSASQAKDHAALGKELAAGATLVVTDSNRKRARRWSTVRDNLGYTERANEHLLTKDPADARLEVFPDAGTDAMTVTEQHGATVTASGYGNPVSYTPEDRAARALDGDLQTAWKVGAFAPVIGERIRIDLESPITTDQVNLVQPIVGDRDRFITRATLVFRDGSRETRQEVALDDSSQTAAGQTITFPARKFDRLEVVVDADNVGTRADYIGVSAVGFAEIRLRDMHAPSSADVRVQEIVRMPTDLTSAAGAGSEAHRLVYVMERLRTLPVPPRYDEELQLSRAFTVPTTREFSLGGDARLDSFAPDTVLDRALGYPGAAEGGVDVIASSRLPGAITARASQAIDGDPSTAWATGFRDPTGKYLEITRSEPVTFDHLALQVVADGRHSVPTRLRVDAGGQSRIVDLPPIRDRTARNAAVSVPTPTFAPLTGDKIRVSVEAVRFVKTIDYFSSSPIIMPIAIAELGIPGVQRLVPTAGVLPQCLTDLVFLDGKPVTVRVVGGRTAAETRGGLSLEQCDAGAPIELAAGRHVLTTAIGRDGGVDVDRLTLGSEAGGRALPVGADGVVAPTLPTQTAPRVKVHDHRTHVTVRVSGATKPFTLVLGESLNAGWHATINGHDLGPAQLVNGYANGWRVDPHGARSFTIELDWTPQARVWWALGISAAALVLCLALAFGWPRRRRRGASAAGAVSVEDPAARFARLRDEGGVPSLLATIVAAVVVAGPVAFFVRPTVGVALGALTALAIRLPRARVVLRFGSPVALAACGAYIAVQQWRFRYPPLFEWPTFFDHVHVLGWTAAALLVAGAVVELVTDDS